MYTYAYIYIYIPGTHFYSAHFYCVACCSFLLRAMPHITPQITLPTYAWWPWRLMLSIFGLICGFFVLILGDNERT